MQIQGNEVEFQIPDPQTKVPWLETEEKCIQLRYPKGIIQLMFRTYSVIRG